MNTIGFCRTCQVVLVIMLVSFLDGIFTISWVVSSNFFVCPFLRRSPVAFYSASELSGYVSPSCYRFDKLDISASSPRSLLCCLLYAIT
uniref:Putative secreted protein n=1 Tax=Amblyomma triste TaxID=251400 RepID=A0A023G3R0_AMBTT